MSKGRIMIQGTMSGAGKSIIAAGLCRVFSKDGHSAAPFKSQNMALNSYITEDGLEMGRAQVVQAEAAGIKPSALMNPVLLKPTTDTGSQVIVNGKVIGNMSARDYFSYKSSLIPEIKRAYDTLAAEYDIMVIEGAGSPAEINLKSGDIVNMGMAKLADAPVIIVGDIDRGGVFAQLVGTAELLEPEERARVKGFVINKFRGDKSLLDSGLDWLEKRTGIPVLGVVPYARLHIDDEDSLTERFSRKTSGSVDIAVIRFDRISNISDFTAFECMEGVSLRYVSDARDLGSPDMVILPGTKNTVADMRAIRQNGLEAAVIRAAKDGAVVMGICGGFQMMGESISDPCGAEGGGEIAGMGLFPMRSVFGGEKVTESVTGTFEGIEIEGYEMHMGVTEFLKPCRPFAELRTRSGEIKRDGAVLGKLYGTYVHGVFDKPQAAQRFVNMLRREKGLTGEAFLAEDFREREYDKLEQLIRANIDMKKIYEIAEEIL